MQTQLLVHPRQGPRRVTGFTLIELMITVAIVAILAAIAYPNYHDYVLRGRLVDATNGLSALQANMERFYQDNRTYMTTGPYTSPCQAAPATLLIGAFQLSCNGADAPTATTYKLTATGQGTMQGFTYTLDNFNVQTSTVVAPAPSNWIIPPCTSTWITKAGQC